MSEKSKAEEARGGPHAASGSEDWICYECVAAFVDAGSRPLVEIWGANQTPHQQGICGKCGKQDTLCHYPRFYWPATPTEGRVVGPGQHAAAMLWEAFKKLKLSYADLLEAAAALIVNVADNTESTEGAIHGHVIKLTMDMRGNAGRSCPTDAEAVTPAKD